MVGALRNLRDLAMRATRGPWFVDTEDEHHVCDAPNEHGSVATWCPDPADAAYIAACSPDVVLKLLDVAHKAELAQKTFHQAAVDAVSTAQLLEWAMLMDESSADLRTALDALEKAE